MTLEWKRRKDGSGFAYYAAPALGGVSVARVSAFTLDGRRLWGASVRREDERRDVHAAPNDPAGYYGAWRTMKAAKAAAEAAYAEMCRAAAMREEMTNYREAGRAGNAEGRAYFAGVKSGRYAAPAQNPRDYGSLVEHARMASATYCGVYAPPAKRARFERAFCAGYRDAEFIAEQAAKESR